ncbi:hypothetical protein [Sphingomonas sp.]|uniref:hypothetical protein n=1 Tax=Sphingomonas sp. TaxID=28214 RepID=UPI0031DE6645
MADETDDELVLTPPEGMEEQPPEEPENAHSEEGEFSIELEGEVAEDETPLVKKLREEIRERDKRLAGYQRTEAPKIEVGPKPTLETCEWDEERYEAELDAWKDLKAKAETAEADAARAQQAKDQENQQRVIAYKAKAAALPVKDFAQAEAAVVSVLPDIHQAALLAYTNNPAQLVYALAKHPQMLDRIASEPDPIRAIILARELEGRLKVTTRAKPPAPEAETIQRSSASMTQTGDKEEERLRKKAEETGDYSALTLYKAQKKKAA